MNVSMLSITKILFLVWAIYTLLKLANLGHISINRNALWIRLCAYTWGLHFRNRWTDGRFLTVLHNPLWYRSGGPRNSQARFGWSFNKFQDKTWSFRIYLFWMRIVFANSAFVGGWAPASLEIRSFRRGRKDGGKERTLAISWTKKGIVSQLMVSRSGVRFTLDHMAFLLFGLVKEFGRCTADDQNDYNGAGCIYYSLGALRAVRNTADSGCEYVDLKLGTRRLLSGFAG